MPGTASRDIAIACQGGGSLTAFTAGVLKTLLRQLDAQRYNIVGLSGTSGGAICATIAWYGLLLGDRKKGEQSLQDFWDDNSATTPIDAWENSWMVFASWFAGSVALPEISPYDVPEIARQRLEELLTRHIPFDQLPALVKDTSPLLYVGAVNEATGEFKVFKGPTLTADKILASAAIPTIFRAVHIDDPGDEGIYWDGLFSQNPPVREFVQPYPTAVEKPDELWVIRINPMASTVEPQTIQQIEIRRNVLSGNLSLNQELFTLEKVNSWVRQGWLPRERFKEIRIREIRLNIQLDLVSKFDRSPSYIRHLISLGEQEGRKFIEELD
jgi:NTE family protein